MQAWQKVCSPPASGCLLNSRGEQVVHALHRAGIVGGPWITPFHHVLTGFSMRQIYPPDHNPPFVPGARHPWPAGACRRGNESWSIRLEAAQERRPRPPVFHPLKHAVEGRMPRSMSSTTPPFKLGSSPRYFAEKCRCTD